MSFWPRLSSRRARVALLLFVSILIQVPHGVARAGGAAGAFVAAGDVERSVFAGARTRGRQEAAPARVYQIAYRLSMPMPSSHLFEVEIEVGGLEGVDSVEFQMPGWSPGRYAVFDFAKNVQEVRAGGHCNPAARCGREGKRVTRLDAQTWGVETNGADSIELSYKVFADDLSGTFSQLDERHANFNGGSVFMYVVGHKADPASLEVRPPHGWKVYNAYTERADQTRFEFPNYDILIDTPTEVAPDFTVQTFEHGGKSYRVLVHAFGPDGGRRPQLTRDLERVVRAQVASMGRPEFDRYTFIVHFDPRARRGDGMEHLNSTQLIEVGEMANPEVYQGAVDTASHEFYHVWNVKRLRPVELGPWDFTRPLATRGLWVAEGLTNYFGKLYLRRAGLWDDRRLFDSLARNITNVERAPGSRLTSAEEASLLAPFLDRAEHAQRTNLQNTAVSYYSKGETLGVALDLLIRGRTQGRSSLEEVMRRAYEHFYLNSPPATYYLRGRGYETEELMRFASEAAGVDLMTFYAAHVRGTAPPPYEEALAGVGLRFVRVPEAQAFDAGLTVEAIDGRRARVASIRAGSPAHAGSLHAGDVLLRVGQTEVTASDWLAALNRYRAGDRVPVVVRRGNDTINFSITLPAQPERVSYRIEKDETARPEVRALRDAWLNGAR
ncbi:MAG TPA: PDZ domain-containing protein [Pyrinomonadaceae bacterium]|nr:PDZ domain-containing protein [Pyrinomonadaceae bacterium]